MRASTFLILSVLIHALCVAAIALSPQRLEDAFGDGNEIEVAMGEPAELPGVETATEPEPQPATQPEPKFEPVKPVEKLTPKPVVKKAEPKPKAAPPVEKTEEMTEPKVSETEPVEEAEELSPEIENVNLLAKEEAQSDGQTEAASTEVASADEIEQEVAAASHEAQEGGDLGKGGATQASAVSYTDLKQTKGNLAPAYPLKARKEGRQGNVDLLYRVTKEGTVTDIRVAKSSGHPDLDQAALNAVSKFRFVPGQEGWAYHPIHFSLKGEPAALPSRLRTAGAKD